MIKTIIFSVLAILVIVNSIPAQIISAQVQTGGLMAKVTTGFLVVKKIVNGGPAGPESFWIRITTTPHASVSPNPFRGSASTVVQISDVPSDGTTAIVTEDASLDYTTSSSGCWALILPGKVSYCTITNTYVGNTSTLPSNGPIESPWGFVIFPNGTVVLLNRTNNYPAGTILYPNGTLVYPKGPVTPAGPQTTPSGAIVFPNGTIIAGGTSTYPKGTILYPNGTTILPNGTTIRSGSQTNPAGGSSSQGHSSIPGWIKNSAKWWSEGQTSDKEYATSIGWLVTNGMINLQSRGSQGSEVVVSDNIQIPSWVRNDANWWAIGAIDDATYAQSLQYLLSSNIITFSKSSNSESQTSTPANDVALQIQDAVTGNSVDALVTISGNSHLVTKETDRDGIAHFSLQDGDYVVSIDSQNYQRLNENLVVTGNLQQTYQIQPMESSTSSQASPPTSNPTSSPAQSSSTNSTQPTNPAPSSQTQAAQISVSPTSANFVHNYFTACPQAITKVSLQSDQQGTWSVSSNPSWTNVIIQNNMAMIVFNCQLDSYTTQTLSGAVTFTFTNTSGATSSATISITGQVNSS